jgi:tetratricopeptide (TPR) repeat protein
VSTDVASASLYNLALCRRMLGQTEEARTLLERYRKEHPSGDEREADVAYQLGDIHDKAGETRLAADEFAGALSAKPRQDLATELHYRLGLCREVLGDDQSAIAAYKQAMAAQDKADAFRVSALVHCAGLYEKAGKYDMALSAYRDLIQNAKDSELVVAAKERVAELEAIGR